jgi:catechol 2,3-dioxygenase-like lactoylglutathione lyase family enzyme
MSAADIRNTARLSGIAPQFLVDDVDAAIGYYRDKLGFDLDFKYEAFYAGVTRDGLAIHLKEAPKAAGERMYRRQNEHLDAYIAVTGVEALHREFQARGAQITKPIGERPWACVDFYVEDADGYILCFSERITSPAARPRKPPLRQTARARRRARQSSAS